MTGNWARLACVIGLLAGATPGQFVNRAVWLGFDEEGVRRSFRQGVEYFLDRMSYVTPPPWWDRGLRRFGNRADFRLGSVSSSDFTLENRLDHRADLGDGISFRYHFVQGENRDARFVRNAVGLEYAVDERTALFVQGTPFADKERIDVSAGAWLWRTEEQALRVMLTGVDAASEKAETFTYGRRPLGVHVAGVFGNVDSHRIAFELGAQLPFEVDDLDDGERLEMHRVIGSIDAHVRLGERDWLVVGYEGESTDKTLRPTTTTTARSEDFDRQFHQLRCEYWRDGPMPWSVGFVHTRLFERGMRLVDDANSLRTSRREWMFLARAQVPLGEKFSIEPHLFGGTVDYLFRDGDLDEKTHSFEGKLGCHFRWDFTPRAYLAIIATTQIDEPSFGGGGAQFVATF